MGTAHRCFVSSVKMGKGRVNVINEIGFILVRSVFVLEMSAEMKFEMRQRFAAGTQSYRLSLIVISVDAT